MHTYATNSPHQTRLITSLVSLTLLATAGIGQLTAWMKGWGYELGGLSSMTIFGALYFAFDRWIWRRQIVRYFLLVPDLNGTWTCSGRTTYRDSAPDDTEWSAEIRIVQSWSKIIVRLQTNQSSSQSIAASLYHEAGAGYRLIYHYTNDPNADQPGLHHHAGVCDLLFNENLSKAQGHYFTGVDRRTNGIMSLAKKGIQA